jgi:hypothetical protein
VTLVDDYPGDGVGIHIKIQDESGWGAGAHLPIVVARGPLRLRQGV